MGGIFVAVGLSKNTPGNPISSCIPSLALGVVEFSSFDQWVASPGRI